MDVTMDPGLPDTTHLTCRHGASPLGPQGPVSSPHGSCISGTGYLVHQEQQQIIYLVNASLDAVLPDVPHPKLHKRRRSIWSRCQQRWLSKFCQTTH